MEERKSPATVYFTAAGACTIYALAPTNPEYESAHASQSLSVARDPSEQITFVSTPHPTLGGIYHPTVRLSAGIGVTFSTSTPSVCPVTREGVDFAELGTCTIDVRQVGVSEAEPPEAEQSVTVKRSQTITFTSTPPDAALAGGSYEASAGSSSGLPVRLTPTGACSASRLEADATERLPEAGHSVPKPSGEPSPTTVYLVAAGTCTVAAQSTCTEEYECAERTSQEFPVGKDPFEEIAFGSTPPSKATVGGSYIPSVISSAGLNVTFSDGTPSVCTFVLENNGGSHVSFIAPGTCTIAARQEGSTEIEPPEAEQSFAVAAKSQTVSFTSTPPSNAIAGESYEVSAASSAGQAVRITTAGACSFQTPSAGEEEGLEPEKTAEEEKKAEEEEKATVLSPATIYFNDAGTCTIQATGRASSEYEASPAVSQSSAVAKDPSEQITFMSSPPSQATVGQSYHPFVRLSAGIRVSFSTSTPSVCTAQIEGIALLSAGTCIVTVRQDGVSAAEAPEAEQSFTVQGKPQTITFTGTLPKATAGASYEVSAVSSSGLPVEITTAGCRFMAPVAGEIESLGPEGQDPSERAAKGEAEEAARKAAEGRPFHTAPVTIYFWEVGTCTIGAKQLGNSEYAAAVGVSESFPVAKDPSEQVTFVSNPPSDDTVGASYQPSVQLSAGIRVSFLTTTPSVCAVKPERGVSLVGVGTCTVAARQEGVAEDEPPEAEQSFAVVKKAQTITFTSTAPSNAVAGGSYAVSATSSSGEPVRLYLSGACAFSPPTAREERLEPEIIEKQKLETRQAPATVYFLAAGTCRISAGASSSPEYTGAQASQSLLIAKNPAERISFVSAPPRRATIGGSYHPTVRLSEHIEVSFFTATPSTCRIAPRHAYVSLVGVGTCTIDVRQEGVSEAEPPEAAQSFKVRRPRRQEEEIGAPCALCDEQLPATAS